MKRKFPDGFNPPRRLSREAMDAVRQLNETDPSVFTTAALANRFKVSPESIRRILKSRWKPPADKVNAEADRRAKDDAEYYAKQAETEVQEMDKLAEKWRSGSADER